MSASTIPLLIDGQDSTGLGQPILRENPARTNEVVGSVHAASPEQVDVAITAASRAWESWRRLPIEERATQVRRAWEFAADERESLARCLTQELGKVLADARGELAYGIANVLHAAEGIGVVADRLESHPEGRFEFGMVPYGVVAAIIPWNAPLVLSSVKVGPALIAGNTVIVKPSPFAPLAVTTYLRSVAERLPAGVLNVVNGDADVGSCLVADPRIGKIAFTGSGAVATSILGAAAANITPSLLELGGNDAAVVLPDVEFNDEVMSRIVFGSFLTAGQVCMAIKRLLVHRDRIDEFSARYIEVANKVLVLGDPMVDDTTVGPVVSAAQRDRIAGLVERASQRGGDVVQLGRQASADFDLAGGYFLKPTLVNGLAADDPLVTGEQFGPTVPVLAFEDDEQAVSIANDSPFGLCASVWSDDEDHAFDLGRRLHVGTVFINTHNRSGMSLRAPFGGVKQSGYGREFGTASLREFSQSRVISRLAASSRGGLDAGRLYPAAGVVA